MRETLFAFDCGSTNWRIYRAGYKVENRKVQLISEPQPSPTTSFVERQLATVILLDPGQDSLQSFGESAYQCLYDSEQRDHVREFFKPCIGAHLERAPLPHQTTYTHAEALTYTRLLLEKVLAQLQEEKWRSRPFDEGIRFAFSYPVHWRDEHQGQILKDFKEVVLSCFPQYFDEQVSFFTEPEAAAFSLRENKVLSRSTGTTLLIDSGGSTTDMFAGRLNPNTGEIEDVRRYGEPHAGGLYDAVLARHIAEQLKIPAAELDKDLAAMHLLRMYARQLKENLSRQLLKVGGALRPPRRAINIILQNGQPYRKNIHLDEAIFNDVTRHLRVDFESLISKGLEAMQLKEEDIQQVTLVGGGVQLFTITRYLRQRFGEKKVILADNPSETVVRGLALSCSQPFISPRRGYAEPDDTSPYIEPVSPPPDLDDDIETQLDSDLAKGVWVLVSKSGEKYPLDKNVVTIGRRRTNDISLDDERVTRFHAEIRVSDAGCAIVDLNSSNGVYVNKIRIPSRRPHLLAARDKIIIGRIKLQLFNTG